MDHQGGNMRRMLAMVAFSLLAALAVPTMASATHSNGQGPAQDFLSGAAKGPVPVPCAPGVANGHFHTNGQAEDNVTNVATGQFWTELEFISAVPRVHHGIVQWRSRVRELLSGPGEQHELGRTHRRGAPAAGERPWRSGDSVRGDGRHLAAHRRESSDIGGQSPRVHHAGAVELATMGCCLPRSRRCRSPRAT